MALLSAIVAIVVVEWGAVCIAAEKVTTSVAGKFNGIIIRHFFYSEKRTWAVNPLPPAYGLYAFENVDNYG